MTQSIITFGFLPTIVHQINHPQTRISSKFSNSANVRNPSLFLDNARRSSVHQNGTSKRRFRVCNVVEPGGSPPAESSFNFLQLMGIATMILPFFTHKWASLLKIRNEVDTAVNIAEGIVEAVEKVADEVEKVAEDIADDLPEGGTLRKAVDFVEHVAERASHDAHLVDTFIDKVQEMEERAEEYFESWSPGASTHQPSTEDEALVSHTIEEKV